jgi:hypothetical protein
MQSFHLRTAALAALLAGGSTVGACSDSPTGPGIQPEIVSQADNFEYQVSAVQGYSGTVSYTWQNTGTAANVDQSTVLTDGSIILLIRDAAGTEVYSRSLADDGTFSTGTGQPGTWSLSVTYSHASGTVNFRLQKAT